MGARVLFSKKQKNGVIVEETHIDQDIDGRYSDDDDVFVQDPYLDLSSASKPLMHPRQRAKVKSRNPVCKCNKILKPVLSFVLLVAVLCSLMLLILYLLNKQNHPPRPPLPTVPKTAALKAKATELVIGCDQIEVEDVWVKGFPKLLTESAFRLVDVNQDGVKDVIFGFATGADGYGAPDVVCDIYFGGTRPCLGGVMALEGGEGSELWRHYTPHEVFALTCASDIDGDGVMDCVAAGRMATLEAVSGRDGRLLWTFGNQEAKVATSNVYTASVIRDLDRDGVLDFLISHGGDPFKKPGSKTRLTGRLLLLSGRTGKVIRWMEVPDRGETYYSTQLFLHPGAVPMVLFGTGGETHPGSLWSLPFEDLIRGQIDKAIQVYRDNSKGVMTPPVLLDLTGDGVEDIIINPFNSSVLAFDGLNYTLLWNYTAPLSESYSTPAAGYFNADEVPDFFVSYSEGPGFPLYFDSKKTVLDGRTGLPLLTSPVQDAVGAQSSPLTISVEGTGNDVFLYWLADCQDHEGQAQQYAFQKGTNVHEQSRADFCRLRFKTSMYTKLLALSRHIPVPGVPIYDSKSRTAVENSVWVNTTEEAEEFLRKHPEHLQLFQDYVYRAHHPEEAHLPPQSTEGDTVLPASEEYPLEPTYAQQYHAAGSKKGPKPAWPSRDQNRYPTMPRPQSPLPDRSRGRSRYRPQGNYPPRPQYPPGVGDAYDRDGGYNSPPYNLAPASQALPPYYDARDGADDYDDEGYDRRYPPPYRYPSPGDVYSRTGGRKRLKRGSSRGASGDDVTSRGHKGLLRSKSYVGSKNRPENHVGFSSGSAESFSEKGGGGAGSASPKNDDVISHHDRRRKRARRDVTVSDGENEAAWVEDFFSRSRLQDVRDKLSRELQRRNKKPPTPNKTEFMKKRKRKRRHVGPHDNDGLQRLVSTGTLAPTSLPATHADYNHSIDVVFATYWFFPAKTSVLLPEDQACIEQMMRNESQRFDPSNPHYGEDHDAWEHYVTGQCLKKNHHSDRDDRVYESQTTYNPYRVHMGQMTVYRLRIKCKCANMTESHEDGRRCSRVLPFDQQQWAAYMGSRGDSHWLPRHHV